MPLADISLHFFFLSCQFSLSMLFAFATLLVFAAFADYPADISHHAFDRFLSLPCPFQLSSFRYFFRRIYTFTAFFDFRHICAFTFRIFFFDLSLSFATRRALMRLF